MSVAPHQRSTGVEAGAYGTARITAAFARAKREGRGLLVGYLMGGDPAPGADVEYLRALVAGGADILEVGIPFSDPMADGPTIQKAATRALSVGTRPSDVFASVRKLRDEGVDVPILTMTYANIPYTMGWDQYATACRDAGVDGTIIPDLPLEECGPLAAAMSRQGLANVLLAAPLTRGERLARVLAATHGFAYLVGSFGTTGARDALAPETLDLLATVRPAAQAAGVPIAVGFGVSDAAHVRTLVAHGADGVVVGSALVRLVEEDRDADTLRTFVAALARGTRTDV